MEDDTWRVTLTIFGTTEKQGKEIRDTLEMVADSIVLHMESGYVLGMRRETEDDE